MSFSQFAPSDYALEEDNVFSHLLDDCSPFDTNSGNSLAACASGYPDFESSAHGRQGWLNGVFNEPRLEIVTRTTSNIFAGGPIASLTTSCCPSESPDHEAFFVPHFSPAMDLCCADDPSPVDMEECCASCPEGGFAPAGHHLPQFSAVDECCPPHLGYFPSVSTHAGSSSRFSSFSHDTRGSRSASVDHMQDECCTNEAGVLTTTTSTVLETGKCCDKDDAVVTTLVTTTTLASLCCDEEHEEEGGQGGSLPRQQLHSTHAAEDDCCASLDTSSHNSGHSFVNNPAAENAAHGWGAAASHQDWAGGAGSRLSVRIDSNGYSQGQEQAFPPQHQQILLALQQQQQQQQQQEQFLQQFSQQSSLSVQQQQQLYQRLQFFQNQFSQQQQPQFPLPQQGSLPPFTKMTPPFKFEAPPLQPASLSEQVSRQALWRAVDWDGRTPSSPKSDTSPRRTTRRRRGSNCSTASSTSYNSLGSDALDDGGDGADSASACVGSITGVSPCYNPSLSADLLALPFGIERMMTGDRRSVGGCRYPEPGELEVCTLMCMADMAFPLSGFVDLQKFAETFVPKVNSEEGIMGFMYRTIIKGSIVVPKRQFGRQVQFRVKVGANPNIIVKMFHTAKLHLTGCKELSSARTAIRVVIEALHEASGQCQGHHLVLIGGNPGLHLINKCIDSVQVVNANCTFDCGTAPKFMLVPEKVMSVFQQPCFSSRVLRAEYDTELQGKRGWYPGVKVYLKRLQTRSAAAAAAAAALVDEPIEGKEKTSKKTEADDRPMFVGVFCSGKVIISGARSLEEARDAYVFVRAVLYDSYESIRSEPVSVRISATKKIRRPSA